MDGGQRLLCKICNLCPSWNPVQSTKYSKYKNVNQYKHGIIVQFEKKKKLIYLFPSFHSPYTVDAAQTPGSRRRPGR